MRNLDIRQVCTDPDACPTPTAHKRLDEAHHFWHGCLDGYQEPELFRANLNAAIQALRNVTWVMQKEKRLIPGFDDWYLEQQTAMTSGAVMKWVVKSRNRIVKEGDLETESTLHVRVINTYNSAAEEVLDSLPPDLADATSEELDKASEKVYTPPVRYRVEDIVASVLKGTPRAILKQSVLAIERRWVDSKLPDRELLEAMAHAHGVLSAVVSSAHAQVGQKVDVWADVDGELLRLPPLADHGRLQCMRTSRLMRTETRRLDGEIAEGGLLMPTDIFGDPQQLEASRKHYGYGDDLPRYPDQVDTILDLLDTYVARARRVLLVDPEHGWFVWAFSGFRLVTTLTLAARDRIDKHDLAQRLAEFALMNDVDGIVMISEIWGSKVTLDDEGIAIAPTDHPDRWEALTIQIEVADGRRRSALIHFERPATGGIVLGETVIDEEQDAPKDQFLTPLREVWRRRAGPPG